MPTLHDTESARPSISHRPVDRLDQLARDRLSTARIFQAVDQHQEFVAALARQGIAGADRAAQAFADFDQQAVADVVAERIVDVLEAVEVDEQQRQARAAALGLGDRLAQAVGEQQAVRQARQVVARRQVFDVALGALALGDVVDAGHQVRLAVKLDRLHRYQHVGDLAGLAAQAQRRLAQAALFRELRHQARAFGVVDPHAQVGRRGADRLGAAIAEHAYPRVVYVDAYAAVAALDRDRVGAGAEHAVRSSERSRSALAALALGNVDRGTVQNFLAVELDHRAGEDHLHDFAVLFAHLGFQADHRFAGGKARLQALAGAGVGPDADLGGGAADHLVAAVAVALATRRIDVQVRAVGKAGDGDGLRARLYHAREALLRSPEQPFGALAVGDVHRGGEQHDFAVELGAGCRAMHLDDLAGLAPEPGLDGAGFAGRQAVDQPGAVRRIDPEAEIERARTDHFGAAVAVQLLAGAVDLEEARVGHPGDGDAARHRLENRAEALFGKLQQALGALERADVVERGDHAKLAAVFDRIAIEQDVGDLAGLLAALQGRVADRLAVLQQGAQAVAVAGGHPDRQLGARFADHLLARVAEKIQPRLVDLDKAPRLKRAERNRLRTKVQQRRKALGQRRVGLDGVVQFCHVIASAVLTGRHAKGRACR